MISFHYVKHKPRCQLKRKEKLGCDADLGRNETRLEVRFPSVSRFPNVTQESARSCVSFSAHQASAVNMVACN